MTNAVAVGYDRASFNPRGVCYKHLISNVFAASAGYSAILTSVWNQVVSCN